MNKHAVVYLYKIMQTRFKTNRNVMQNHNFTVDIKYFLDKQTRMMYNYAKEQRDDRLVEWRIL